jgi:hypothetical protein
MIAGVASPSVSIVIGMAVFVGLFGLAGWFVERSRGRTVGLALLIGLPGVCLAALPFFGAPRWLLAPGLVLLVASYLVQVFSRR